MVCVDELILHMFTNWANVVISFLKTVPVSTFVQVLVHNSSHGADTGAFHPIPCSSTPISLLRGRIASRECLCLDYKSCMYSLHLLRPDKFSAQDQAGSLYDPV